MAASIINLGPLIEAGPAVKIHAAAAIASLLLGAVVLFVRKGDARHRTMGRLWAGLMAITAVSSFWIRDNPVVLGFGPIHTLSVITLIGLFQGVMAARARRIEAHRKGMRSLYFFALIAAGTFTLLPGRRMHAVLLERLPVLGDAPPWAMAAAFAGVLALAFFVMRRARLV
jgi:uncharacterized membrane protein